MYSLAGYGDMIRDPVRMEAYATALRQAIVPGATVVDIGTGTGIMACLACAYGAARVYAIEPAEAIEVARAIARANRLDDRIEFIQQASTTTEIGQQADVVVSDLRGVLPLFQHHLPSIIDARRRLLKPGGALVPRRDVLRAAVARAPDLYDRHVGAWDGNDHGLDMSAASRIETNAWRQCRARVEHLLLEPQDLAMVDYRSVEHPDVTGRLEWTASCAGSAHGLLVWFDADLGDGVGFTNAPGAPELIYGQAFFPWSRAVPLDIGDTVQVSMRAVLLGDDYVWTWETTIAGGQRRQIKAAFRQSTFYGTPLSRATLAKRSADHVPSLNEDGRVDRLILERLDQHASLGRIADEVLAKFPGRLPTHEQALARVADLSARYSE